MRGNPAARSSRLSLQSWLPSAMRWMRNFGDAPATSAPHAGSLDIKPAPLDLAHDRLDVGHLDWIVVQFGRVRLLHCRIVRGLVQADNPSRLITELRC